MAKRNKAEQKKKKTFVYHHVCQESIRPKQQPTHHRGRQFLQGGGIQEVLDLPHVPIRSLVRLLRTNPPPPPLPCVQKAF